MWQRLSFRTQLFLPLGVMFLAALIMGAVLLHVFTTVQLAEENEPAQRSTRAVAEALNNTLRSSDNPRKTLDDFVRMLDPSSDIQFHSADAGSALIAPKPLRDSHGPPRWFVDLLTIPDLHIAFPVTIGGQRVGDIVYSPDLSAALFETWAGFLSLAVFVVALAALTAIIAYAIAGTALRPLQTLGEGLTRMRRGDYGHVIPAAGPPEIRHSCEEANELARTLLDLSQDNRDLLRRLVSLQDDERQGLARELHDELGPLLFSIRAGTVALLEMTGEANAPAQLLLQSVEMLQQTNRRILDGLRPLYIHELGLARSVQTLLQNFRSQAPQIALTTEIDPALNRIDGLLSQTVYRVIQEGLTNVLRHAHASHAHIRAGVSAEELTVEISDDGVGFPSGNEFGRGLTGMQERARALSGSLQLLRTGERTYVRCRLPAGEQRVEQPDD